MSDTPNQPEDIRKLLDNGYAVVLFANEIGTITAAALPMGKMDAIDLESLDENKMTDDFTVGQVLYRLAEKATTGRIA